MRDQLLQFRCDKCRSLLFLHKLEKGSVVEVKCKKNHCHAINKVTVKKDGSYKVTRSEYPKLDMSIAHMYNINN